MTVGVALEDRFEILKEIGDGSFGSVALARVRTAGSNIARRGSVVRTQFLSLSSSQNILSTLSKLGLVDCLANSPTLF